jgi:single-stranded DNA-binding protein
VCVTGRIGNPKSSTPKSKLLWTAGIAVTDQTNGKVSWTNVTAWDGVARKAQEFQRGDYVTVCGKIHRRTYIDSEGVEQAKESFIVSSITSAS